MFRIIRGLNLVAVMLTRVQVTDVIIQNGIWLHVLCKAWTDKRPCTYCKYYIYYKLYIL